MQTLDWIVLIGTLGFIALYGMYKTTQQKGLNDYLLGEQELSGWKVAFAVMATQASAITFISTTGQGYSDGLRFVQFYLGLPLAMIVICITFIPAFYKLKVYTAYEFLEQRFDVKTRTFAAGIFLIQRGLAAGITLYAPSIILSTVFDWNLQTTHLISGLVVILYTISGGAKAVNVTQLLQMAVIIIGMVFIFVFILYSLPQEINFVEALKIAGGEGKMNAISFDLNFNDRYNFWAGIMGGFFLALAYFGTDQSQVQRYLGGKNIRESKMGLIMNGIFKIPMQIFILMCGVMLFVFFQFEKTPILFNDKLTDQIKYSYPQEYNAWNKKNDELFLSDVKQNYSPSEIHQLNEERNALRNEVQTFVKTNMPAQESNDRDYIFLYFIIHYLPRGCIGLLLAVILCAAMSSISAELNALAGTSMVDFKKRFLEKHNFGLNEVQWSKLLTSFWGVVAISFALYANLFENLIQFINIIGSLFYGTVLGIFVVAFYTKNIKGNAVFLGAVVAQLTVLILFFTTDIGFLWYNVIACGIVYGISAIWQKVENAKTVSR